MFDVLILFAAPSEVTAKRERRARVAFSYAAESVDEISLDPGQVTYPSIQLFSTF